MTQTHDLDSARTRPAESARPKPVGLVLVRDAEILGAEPFFHEFIAGIEHVLIPHGTSVFLQVVSTVEEAMDCYRRWASLDQVQGVILIDLYPDDARITLVRELGLPAVVIGDPETASELDSVWTEDDVAMHSVVAALTGLGHRRLGHVTGPASMAHTRIRRAAFEQEALERGATVTVFDGDYSEAAGASAIAGIREMQDRPTALVFDNDLMAMGALAAARQSGIRVPEELSLVAWDDSALCQLASPSLTAMSHDVQGLGELVGTTLREVLAGNAPGPRRAPAATLVQRESSGPAPRPT